jgi:hypothetical protein
MAVYLAQVRFPNISGFPEDTCVHTFHFTTAAAAQSAPVAQSIADQLISFYNVSHLPGGSPLGNEMSNVIARALCQIKIYNITPAPPHAPILTVGFTLTATSSSGMANEVALVLSYNGLVTAGVPARRNRGRMYFGPLVVGNTSIDTGDLRPTTTMINKLAGAGSFLTPPFGTIDVINWCVYSRVQRALGRPVEEYAIPVAKIHVDNAFDTQRRRGRAATSRVTIP